MLTISPKALKYIRSKGASVYLGRPITVASCCLSFQEAPTPHLGKPESDRAYLLREIDGITCYVPKCLSGDKPLTLALRNLFGIRWLEVDGWTAL